MKQYSAPILKQVVLHTEAMMQTASLGEGKVNAADMHTSEKSLGTEIWNDKETEE